MVARGIKKRYKDTEALRGVDFEVNEGEVFCVLGPNGAGKTTLLKILTAQLKPTEGTVEILGIPIDQLLSSDRRHELAIVPQEDAIWKELTVRENLDLIAESYRLDKPTRERKIKEVLDLFDLTEHQKKLVSKLSGGQARKVAIALSLLHDPKLLFLDEPTAGLDVNARNVLLANLKALRHRGLTIVFTTHLMEEAELLADRVMLLDEGRIVALAGVQDLITNACGEEVLEVLIDKANVEPFLDFLRTNGDDQLKHVKIGIKHLVGGNQVASFVEKLLKNDSLKKTFISMTVRRPTLNDAFMFLTAKDVALTNAEHGGLA